VKIYSKGVIIILAWSVGCSSALIFCYIRCGKRAMRDDDDDKAQRRYTFPIKTNK